MLSRVAENVYWLARYLERAEDTARLLSVNSHPLLSLAGLKSSPSRAMMNCLTNITPQETRPACCRSCVGIAATPAPFLVH